VEARPADADARHGELAARRRGGLAALCCALLRVRSVLPLAPTSLGCSPTLRGTRPATRRAATPSRTRCSRGTTTLVSWWPKTMMSAYRGLVRGGAPPAISDGSSSKGAAAASAPAAAAPSGGIAFSCTKLFFGCLLCGRIAVPEPSVLLIIPFGV
jgi:hypothetical protein